MGIKIQSIAVLIISFISISKSLLSQEYKVQSPNKKIELSLVSKGKNSSMTWYLKVGYLQHGDYLDIIPSINLGLKAQNADFSSSLTFIGADKVKMVSEAYYAVHGKRKNCANTAIERTFNLKADRGKRFSITLRAYNDGIAFRYGITGKKGETLELTDELTSYQIPVDAERWLQRFVTSYEGFYPVQHGAKVRGEWGYPCLFKKSLGKTDCWMLISEAGLDGSYCATKLGNTDNENLYKLRFPASSDGNGTGKVNPSVSLPWSSPWRTVIIGDLAQLVESTLVEDVSPACKIKDVSWIKPGASSWVYWANNHGTMDFKKVKEYIDLAARMNWPYTLFDWEWDAMGNGGKLEDAVKYANQKGIRPMMWYNSGGAHNGVSSTPRDRMLTHERRMKEFRWLNEIGVYGVKIDFFESDKKDMIKYYIDILEDAAKFKLMVNFHGSTLPRGWSRTYPNLMSMEAVFGAEQYNNGTEMTGKAAVHNATLPFTRNVVGPMDYTPVTFTNSQHPHMTTFAHELALSVVFESGIQHMADRPEGFDNLPDAPKSFLREVPVAWDDTRFISGYPGKNIIIARRHKDDWYLAGINGLDRTEQLKIPVEFLKKGKRYNAVLIADGTYDSAFETTYLNLGKEDHIVLKWLARGGFTCVLKELP